MKVFEVRVMHSPFGNNFEHMAQCLIDHNDDPKACCLKFEIPFVERDVWSRDAARVLADAYEDYELIPEIEKTVIPQMLEAIDKYLEKRECDFSS